MNPWSDASPRLVPEKFKEKDLNEVSSLARVYGRVPKESDIQELTKEDSSIKLLSLLRQLQTFREEAHTLSDAISKRRSQKQTAEFTRIDRLSTKIDELVILSDHVDLLLNNVGTLTLALQQPYTGPHLIVPAENQSKLVSLFERMVKTISEIATHADNIAWLSNFDLQKDNDANIFSETPALLALYNRVVDGINTLRGLIDEIYEKEVLVNKR